MYNEDRVYTFSLQELLIPLPLGALLDMLLPALLMLELDVLPPCMWKLGGVVLELY